MGFYGIPWIPAIKIKQFELTLFQTPMISVGTIFPWPKHSRFDVLSWLATWGHRGCAKVHQYSYQTPMMWVWMDSPWSTYSRFFLLTWDPEDSEGRGCAEILLYFLLKTPTIWASVYRLPLTQAFEIWHFGLTWDLQDIEGVWRFICFLFQTATIRVSMDSPWSQHSKYDILS